MRLTEMNDLLKLSREKKNSEILKDCWNVLWYDKSNKCQEKGSADMLEKLWYRFTRKGFYIELEAENMFPNTKGFVFPHTGIMLQAIEKYCRNTKEELTFLSKVNPITFQLNGKEIYRAELVYHRGKDYGYKIHCVEMPAEKG